MSRESLDRAKSALRIYLLVFGVWHKISLNYEDEELDVLVETEFGAETWEQRYPSVMGHKVNWTPVSEPV